MRSRDESLFEKIIDFVNEYFEDYGRSLSTREIEQVAPHDSALPQNHTGARRDQIRRTP